jgi:hypothetical protein
MEFTMEHYSDCYQLIKTIKDRDIRARLKAALKDLESDIHQESFVDYIKTNRGLIPAKNIIEMRNDYDHKQLQTVVSGIDKVITDFSLDKQLSETDYTENDFEKLTQIKTILDNVKASAHTNIDHFEYFYQDYYAEFQRLANQYASDYIPFNQSVDPFQSKKYDGYCWGHTYRFAEMASRGILDRLSIASDKKLYKRFQKNWTMNDILFKRVGLYMRAMHEDKVRKVIWQTLSELDEHTIFNFNFSTPGIGAHSTCLRMSGEQIEYYDNNYGVVRFESREKAANFLSSHLVNMADKADYVADLISVYKLPVKNDPQHSIFDELPEATIQTADVDPVVSAPFVVKSIADLLVYARTLDGHDENKSKAKAHEIRVFSKELFSLNEKQVLERVQQVLRNPNHTLMLKRGIGFQFFKDEDGNRTTTQALLRQIVISARDATENTHRLGAST